MMIVMIIMLNELKLLISNLNWICIKSKSDRPLKYREAPKLELTDVFW